VLSQSWTYVRSSLRFISARAIRPRLILPPCLLVHRPYVSISPPLQRSLRFLGHPTPPRLAAWSPAPALPERALSGFPRSVCPFSVTLGRYFAPCPSYRVDTTYESITWPNGDKFPFGPVVCPSRQLAVRQVATHDTYVPSSKILSIVTCSGRCRFRLAAYPLLSLALRRLMTSLPP
jgi:hypothetical protein